ncbi:MAG: O-antigen ligase family protein [Acidimicrobiales bacterium]
MAFALPSDVTSYRFDRKLLVRPGYVERALVVLTTSVLLAGLPVDWFRTRVDVVDEGNLKLVVAWLLLMLLGVLRVIGSLDSVLRVIKLETTIFAFSGLALASLFWSADIGETIRQATILIAIAFYGVYLILRFQLVQIVRLLAVTFTINAACSFLFVFAFPAYGLSPAGQWIGVYYQKNALGFAATLAMPLLIVAARMTPRVRLIFYAAAIGHGVLLFFSESKTMYVAGFGSVVLLGVYRLFRGRRTLRGAVLLSLAGSSLFTVAFATANIGILAKWLDKDVSLTGRIPLWEDLIPVVLERVALGHGYRAAFGGYFSPVHEIWIKHTWQPPHAHNGLFHIWLELGLVGLVLFLIGFFRAVKRAIHAVNLVPGAIGLWPLAFLSTSLLVSITESGITATEIGWLMYVVAVLAVSNWFKNKVILVSPSQLEALERMTPVDDSSPSPDIDLIGANVG